MKLNSFVLFLAAIAASVTAFTSRLFGGGLVLANISPTSGATLRGDLNAAVQEAAFNSSRLIGLKVMPPFPVNLISGQYPKLQIAAGELMTALATERGNSATYGEVSRQWTTDSYDCIDRGLEEPIDDKNKKDLSRYFDLEKVTAKNVLNNMMLAHEVRVAAQIFNTTNFGTATNSVVAYTSANIATIDFVQDVTAAIERIGDKGGVANTIVMNSIVLARLINSAKLQNFVRGPYGNKDLPINAKTIQQAFADLGIENVFIAGARQNTAKKGQAASLSPIWANTYIWVGEVMSSPSLMQEGGAGYTLVYNEEGGIFVTETYRIEQRRSNMVRVRHCTAEKVVDPTAGTLIGTQYS